MRRRKSAGLPFAMPIPKPPGIVAAKKSPIVVKNEVIPIDQRAISMTPEELDRQLSGGPHCTMAVENVADNLHDRRMFGIQETEDGWKAYAVWQAEGKGAPPPFLKLFASNYCVFNLIGNKLLGMDPKVISEVETGELYLEERGQQGLDNFVDRFIGFVPEILKDNFKEEDDMT